MKKIDFLFIILVAGILGLSLSFLGCGTQSINRVGGATFFPHKDGYAWTYELRSSNTSEVRFLRYRFDNTAISPISGTVEATIWKSGFADASDVVSSEQESLTLISDAGVNIFESMFGSFDNILTDQTLILPFPFDVGSSWTTTGSAGNTSTSEVVARESVTVPAGQFDCYKIVRKTFFSYGGPSVGTGEIWMGDGVGIVKVISSTITNSLEENRSLTLKSKNF